MVDFTAELFNFTARNILRYHERVELDNEHVEDFITAYENLPDVQQTWHIQRDKNKVILWRRKAWLTDIEHRKKVEKDRAYYSEVLDERKAYFRDICLAVCNMLELPPEEFAHTKHVQDIALRTMKKKLESTGELLGIDLSKIRELPAPHTVINPVTKETDYIV